MKAEFQRTLKVTKNEQDVISTLMDILEEVFGLNLEEEPEDLANIMYCISMESPRVYLNNNKGVIEIKYQDD